MSKAHVALRVFDLRGRLVRRLVDGVTDAGSRTATWDGCDDQGAPVAAGVYFFQLVTSSFAQSRKVVLIR